MSIFFNEAIFLAFFKDSFFNLKIFSTFFSCRPTLNTDFWNHILRPFLYFYVLLYKILLFETIFLALLLAKKIFLNIKSFKKHWNHAVLHKMLPYFSPFLKSIRKLKNMRFYIKCSHIPRPFLRIYKRKIYAYNYYQDTVSCTIFP